MEATKRKQVKRQRATAKTALTRMQKFIDSGDCKLNETQVRYDDLQGIFDRFDTAQLELELSDDTDYTADREAFEIQYYEVKAKFIEVLRPVLELPRSRHSSPVSTPRSHNGSVNIKLPTIALPTFDGETCNWLQFRDTFEALIVNNTSLTDVQRFHYLLASLKNEAKDLISNLQITNENFTVAWNLITQRYNNTRLIAMMHAKQLVNMPQVRKGNAASLRRLINYVTSNLNALKALELKAPVQDLMLNHLMLATMDPETQREWELETASRADIPLTTDLITFMESRCQALELIQTTQPVKVQPTTSRASYSTRSKVSKPTRTYVATHVQCSLCHESHRLYRCDQFQRMSVQQRRNYVRQSKRCFNCLQVYTRKHTCSEHVCRKCNARHHTLLHFDKYHQHFKARSVNNNAPTIVKGTSTHKKLTVNKQNNAPTGVNTYCTFKGKPQNQVLLATAMV